MPGTDSGKLDMVASGLSIYGGRTIVGDATLRSPLSGKGEVQGAADTTDGATFVGARRNKADAYPELVHESARHKFLVLATEVGGRFSEECIDLVRKLVSAKGRTLNDTNSGLIKLIYSRRWWGILSMAAQRAVALNLLGGPWAPLCEWAEPTEEELLCCPECPPVESRMR